MSMKALQEHGRHARVLLILPRLPVVKPVQFIRLCAGGRGPWGLIDGYPPGGTSAWFEAEKVIEFLTSTKPLKIKKSVREVKGIRS